MRDQLIEARSHAGHVAEDIDLGPGIEMAKHAEVTAALGTLVYFCDPASPWQRASNENANGLLRQYFRKGDDLSTVEPADVLFAAQEINGRPMAVLDWSSAAARFAVYHAAAAKLDDTPLVQNVAEPADSSTLHSRTTVLEG